MRDAITPLMETNAQENPTSFLVTSPAASGAAFFDAADAWVSVQPVVLLQNAGYRPLPNVGVVLSTENEKTFIASEPFFVSGARRFTFFESGDYLVTTASRRELLSTNAPFSGTSTDPRQTQAASLSGSVGLLSSSANWFYLDHNLAWQQDTIGNTGVADPFGFASGISAARRGRYYDIAYQFETTVGTLSVYLVHRIGTARPAFLISVGPTGLTGQSGIIHVGDDTPIAPLGGYAAAGNAQASMLGSSSWTIAVTNNVSATLSGTLYVVRRGF